MKITKSQLKEIIKESVTQELFGIGNKKKEAAAKAAAEEEAKKKAEAEKLKDEKKVIIARSNLKDMKEEEKQMRIHDTGNFDWDKFTKELAKAEEEYNKANDFYKQKYGEELNESQKNNKMKITKSQLKEIIKEEASKYVYSKSLIEKRETIKEAISKINEGEDISEEELQELFGSMGAGLKSVGKMIGGKAKEAAGKVTDAAKEVAGKATDAVQKAAGDVKQAYQSGVDKAKYEKAQKEIANIAQQIQGLKQKMKNDEAQLQSKYAELTGGKPFKGAVHNPVMSEGKVIWEDGLDDIILV